MLLNVWRMPRALSVPVVTRLLVEVTRGDTLVVRLACTRGSSGWWRGDDLMALWMLIV